MTATPDPVDRSDTGSSFIISNRKAVKRYLKTVVIADNEPVIRADNDQPITGATLQQPAATARKQPSASKTPAAAVPAPASDESPDSHSSHTLNIPPAAAVPDPASDEPPDSHSSHTLNIPPAAAVPAPASDEPPDILPSHTLNIQSVTNAFATHGMICGSYLPEKDTSNQDITETLKQLVTSADAAILDWQIGSTESKSQPTVDAIATALKKDQEQGGRLRLIVIYTAEHNLDKIRDTLNTELKSAGINDLSAEQDRTYPILTRKNVRIVCCNKENSSIRYLSPVRPQDLVEFVIEQFEILSRGLLRSYALSCVAAIRENSSRLMAQYRPELDGAFVAQRASIPDPDDATDMMHDIMQSDLSAILRDPALDAYLSGKACVDWFTHSGLTNDDEINTRIKQGVPETKSKKKNTPRDIHELFYADPTDAKTQPKAMSRMSVYAQAQAPSLLREISGCPTLSLGTLLYDRAGDRYALCIVPRCDSVRLDFKTYNVKVEVKGKINRKPYYKINHKINCNIKHYLIDNQNLSHRYSCNNGVKYKKGIRFPFIELKKMEDSENNFFLITPDDTDKSSLTIEGKKISRAIFNIPFSPASKTKTIRAQKKSNDFIFTDLDGIEWQWVGTLREMVAQNIVASVCNAFNRVGLNEHEWLRSRKPF